MIYIYVYKNTQEKLKNESDRKYKKAYNNSWEDIPKENLNLAKKEREESK